MALARNLYQTERKKVRKKTAQGCSRLSKGGKPYRGQGGSRKRVKQSCKPGRQGPKK